MYPVIIDPKNEVEIVYELPVTDEKTNNPVEIRKTDITGTKELAGAVLEVRAYNGALISSWVSNGSAHVIADVQPGTYTLTEKSPANGYVTAESMVNHPNWFDASFISWLSYDSLHLELPDGNLYFAPIINWGKYREENGRLVMPVTVRLNHAIADGYLVANVFRLLEQEIRCFVGL